MKTVSLLLALVFANLGTLLYGSEMVTLLVPPGAGVRYSETTIVLLTGDWARVEFNGRSLSNGSPLLEVQFGGLTFDMATFVESAYGDNGVPVITGPATIRAKRPSGDGGPSLATLSITRAGVAVPSVPSTAVVIPEDAAGEFQVILESSTDLITWTPAMPGSYGGSTQKRFFRTRIVRTN